MKFNIAGFSDTGTLRQINQDRILVQNKIHKMSSVKLINQDYCFCFVADGIGGNPSGDLAAEYVLEKLIERLKPKTAYDDESLKKIFNSINDDLISLGKSNSDYFKSGTTLTGIMIYDNYYKVINAGDSQVWLIRENQMIKLTNDQTLDSMIENSPLISYFGGTKNNLDLSCENILRNVQNEDIFIVTSDGLLKSLSIRQIKSIMSNSKSLPEKTGFILEQALLKGAEDNISSIFIEVIDD